MTSRTVSLTSVIVALLNGVQVPAILAQPANPMPMEPGWTVREVIDFERISSGLGYDPTSEDLFVTALEARPGDMYHNLVDRVTQVGAENMIYSQDISAFTAQFGQLAFDASSRTVYFNPGGQEPPTIMRKIDEDGNFMGDVLVPEVYSGMAFAPDGTLYINYQDEGAIARYNVADDTFSIAYTAVGQRLFGLSFDPSGNAYVADGGGSSLKRVDIGGTVTSIGTLTGAYGSTFGDGSMFTTNASSNIWRVAPDGSGLTIFASGHSSAGAIYFASNDRLYVSDFGDNSVWEYSYIPEPSAILPLIIGAFVFFRSYCQ